jgi:chromosomal replication initiation ATPase DnaA
MDQLPLAFSLRPSYDPVDYLVSESNRPAYEWITHTGRWNSYALRLAGPPGSGRTHLAHIWAQREHASFIAWPDWGTQGAQVLDDASAIREEEKLFHLLNDLRDSGRRLLLVFDDRPLAERFRLPDLLSRLNALPQAQLREPDDTLLAAVLAKQLSDRQLRLPEDVLTYLVARMPRSFQAAGRLARWLDEETLARKKPITVAVAREMLARLAAGDGN